MVRFPVGLAVLVPLLAAALPQAARAENPFGLEVAGWTSRMAQTGTTYFQCAGKACGGSAALLSLRQPGHMARMTLAQFADVQERVNARIREQVADTHASTIGPAQEVESRGVRVFTSTRDYETTAGVRHHFVNALLVGPQASLSVVSDAPTTAQARANFDAFLPRLLDLVLAAPGAPARAN
ncbi:hypothetical protein ACI7BZ_02935 [Xanthobacter sp. AM11]|uniref:hypothetical protein n=1 Tax=Xanthobacter sp. AM11 TaxID=3380643 RepID=UPI0039BF57BC